MVSKILAARLSRVIGKIVSETQTAFIPGRNILGVIIATNELIDFSRRERRSYIMFKVDFAQAYDCVD